MENTRGNKLFFDELRSQWGSFIEHGASTIVCQLQGDRDIADRFGSKTRYQVRDQIRKMESMAKLEFKPIPFEGIDAAVDVHCRTAYGSAGGPGEGACSRTLGTRRS